VRLIARPIDEWPAPMLDDYDRQQSRFKASWSSTVDLLDREVWHLGGDEVVLQLALRDRDFRNDGWIRADAKPEHPGVIVSFESKHGPLRYWTDEFKGSGQWGYLPGWQANVRAVALGLEALRTVDRYGIARAGEQYRGWNALGAGTPMPAAAMTVDDAVRFLHEHAPGVEWDWDQPDQVARAYRAAAARLHPDAGGDAELFRRLTEARDLLLGAS
jgi:hypothetical protein